MLHAALTGTEGWLGERVMAFGSARRMQLAKDRVLPPEFLTLLAGGSKMLQEPIMGRHCNVLSNLL